MNRGTNDDVRQAAASAVDAQVRRAKECEECDMPKGSGLGSHYAHCSQAGQIIQPPRSAIASTPSGALPRPGTGGVDGVAGRPVPPPGSSGDPHTNNR